MSIGRKYGIGILALVALISIIGTACSSADDEAAPAAPAAAAPAAAPAPAAPAAAAPAAAPAPAAPAAKPTAVPVKPVQGVSTAPKKLAETTKVVETTGGPEYGGSLRVVLEADPGSKWSMCEFKAQSMLAYPVENFLMGDYHKGPSGDGSTTFQPRLGIGTDKLAIGALADSWEVPDALTYSFHLREGIKWQPKFPTDGRAVNVDELVAEAIRIWDCRFPRHDFVDDITGDDTDGDGVNDTLTFHTNMPISFWGYEFAWGPYFIYAPPETVAAGLDNPDNQSGTGPWMVKDGGYTAGSTIEFEKNPDYWQSYSYEGTEYQLPFLDGVTEVIIPQEATRLAAIRTGQVDHLMRVRTSDRPVLEKSNPELGRALALEDSFGYFMPMNKPPFDDIRVRKAMSMAIDRQVYTDALHDGNAVVLSFPLQPEWPLHYEGLDVQPESVQEGFAYNPAGAEALLDEAGLTRDGDGVRFEIEMLIRNSNQMELEAAEISIGFWDDIGVEVTLEIVDGPIHQSRLFEKQFDFFANNVTGRPNALNDFRAGHQWNRSNLNDTDWHESWDDVLVATDSALQAQLIKESATGYLELFPSVHTPAGLGGDYWQPWLKNHNGERVLGFVDYSSKWMYVWVDRDMRERETGFAD
jgi:ABC-type transport system substrate-binding protein